MRPHFYAVFALSLILVVIPSNNALGYGPGVRVSIGPRGYIRGHQTINNVNNNSNINNHSQYRGNWNGNYAGRGGYGGYGGYGAYGGFGGGFGTGLGFGLGMGLGSGLLGGYGGYGWGGGYGGYGMGYGGYGMGYGGYGSYMGYNSGYLGYSNPYYNNSYGTYGNYSYLQPIPVANPTSVVSGTGSACDQSLDTAAEAFKQKNYDLALDTINKGIVQCPTDAVLHEFRALILFAKSDYQQAAATIHSVLAVGSGWNWTTLSGLYSGVPIYTAQLRALEAFSKSNPQDAAAHFLLAYHYMVDGYPEAAARQLKQVPNDRVASDVLALISKPDPGQSVGTTDHPSPQPPPMERQRLQRKRSSQSIRRWCSVPGRHLATMVPNLN